MARAIPVDQERGAAGSYSGSSSGRMIQSPEDFARPSHPCRLSLRGGEGVEGAATDSGATIPMKRFWLAAPAAAVLTALTALAPDCRGSEAVADDPKPVKPVNLDCNTKADEDDPLLSSSGIYLYYAMHRQEEIRPPRVETRQAVSGRPASRWAATSSRRPQNAGRRPRRLRHTGRHLSAISLFRHQQLDEKGDNFDLYVSYRDGANQDFVPPEAVNVTWTRRPTSRTLG